LGNDKNETAHGGDAVPNGERPFHRSTESKENYMHRFPLILLCLAFVVVGQVPDQIRRATISGSGGTTGKCTLEVRVDHAAEVDVYGDSGRLRTISGQPATWTRMDCTAGLPSNMSDFRFRGIDGRGRVKLAQDPRNNNGMAVIRIDDTKGGAEGYTFSIEWSGASEPVSTGGFDNGMNPADPVRMTGRSGRGSYRTGRADTRMSSTENAIDLCRTEVRTRAERDYDLRNIDITSAGIDTNAGRRDTITGTFNSRGGSVRRGSGYRFSCVIDYASGQVRTVDIQRSDGTPVQPARLGQSGYDQNRNFRACQDAVVARAARDAYQDVRFTSTATDTRRANWISGTITASRGPVTDTFDFGCAMDFGTAQVQNVELTRR
jgi:hypothetical protein